MDFFSTTSTSPTVTPEQQQTTNAVVRPNTNNHDEEHQQLPTAIQLADTNDDDTNEPKIIIYHLHNTFLHKLVGEDTSRRIIRWSAANGKLIVFICAGLGALNVAGIVIPSLRWATLDALWVLFASIFFLLVADQEIVFRYLLFKLDFLLNWAVCILYAVSFSFLLRFDVRCIGGWTQLFVAPAVLWVDAMPPQLKALRTPMVLLSTLAYISYTWLARGAFYGGVPDGSYPSTDYFLSFGTLGGLARNEIIISAREVAGDGGFALALLSFKNFLAVYLNGETDFAVHIVRSVRVFAENDPAALQYEANRVRYWRRSNTLLHRIAPNAVDPIIHKLAYILVRGSPVLFILMSAAVPGTLVIFPGAQYLTICTAWAPLLMIFWISLVDMCIAKEISYRIEFWLQMGLGVIYSVSLSAYMGWNDVRLIGVWCTFAAPLVIHWFDAITPQLAVLRLPIILIACGAYLTFTIIIRFGYIPTNNTNPATSSWNLGTFGGIARYPVILSDQQFASEIAFTMFALSLRDVLHVVRYRHNYRTMYLGCKVEKIDGDVASPTLPTVAVVGADKA